MTDPHFATVHEVDQRSHVVTGEVLEDNHRVFARMLREYPLEERATT